MLTDLYAAIGAAEVAVNGSPVPGMPLDELREYQPDAHLPCRLLLPFGQRRATDRLSFDYGRSGPSTTQWHVTDLLLYKAIGSGAGMIEVAEPLVQYREDYATMVFALRQTLDSCYEVQAVDFNSGPQQWDGTWFWGVEAVWTVNVLME